MANEQHDARGLGVERRGNVAQGILDDVCDLFVGGRNLRPEVIDASSLSDGFQKVALHNIISVLRCAYANSSPKTIRAQIVIIYARHNILFKFVTHNLRCEITPFFGIFINIDRRHRYINFKIARSAIQR